jgi:hypothetical protein
MSLRFQRRMTLFPGVRLNFSARGISTTIGVPGASVNVGLNGATLNLGVPGTGVSLRHRLGPHERASPASPPQTSVPQWIPHEVPGGSPIQSAPLSEVTSDGLSELKQLIKRVLAERETLNTTVSAIRTPRSE